MQMALKIWRYDSSKGERALKEYEFDAPDWATLLDCLDIVKDKVDGSLAYRKSCRVSECNAMESDPEFKGPQALAKGMRFVGDPRDARKAERLDQYATDPNGIWECTRCFFCNERCPKGVDPRDAIAKLGAEAIKAGIDRDMGAKHAKWFVRSTETTGWLRETELVPKTQGIVSSVKQMKFAMSLVSHNKA